MPPPSQQLQQQQQHSNGSSSPDTIRTSPLKTVSLRVPPLLQRALPSGEAGSASFVCEALRLCHVEPPLQLLKSNGRQVVYVAAGAAADCSVGFEAPPADTPPLQRPAPCSHKLSAPPAHAHGSLFSSPALFARAQAAAAAALAAATSAQRLADLVVAVSGHHDGIPGDEDSPAATAAALAARAHAAAQEACCQAQLVLCYEPTPAPPPALTTAAAACTRDWVVEAPAERTAQEAVADYRAQLLDVLDHLARRPLMDSSPTTGFRACLLAEHDGQDLTRPTTRLLRAVEHIKGRDAAAGAFAGLGATRKELTAVLLRSCRWLFRSRRDGAQEAQLLAAQLRADAESSADAPQHGLAVEVLRQLLLSFTMQALLVKPDISQRRPGMPAGQQQCSPRCRPAGPRPQPRRLGRRL